MQKIVPVIPIRDGIIFPSTDSVLTFGRPRSLSAIESSFKQEKIVCFVLQKNSKLNDPTPDDIYSEPSKNPNAVYAISFATKNEIMGNAFPDLVVLSFNFSSSL